MDLYKFRLKFALPVGLGANRTRTTFAACVLQHRHSTYFDFVFGNVFILVHKPRIIFSNWQNQFSKKCVFLCGVVLFSLPAEAICHLCLRFVVLDWAGSIPKNNNNNKVKFTWQEQFCFRFYCSFWNIEIIDWYTIVYCVQLIQAQHFSFVWSSVCTLYILVAKWSKIV